MLVRRSLHFIVAQVKASTKGVHSVTSFLATAQMAGVALSIAIATSIFVNQAAADVSFLMLGMPRDVVYAGLEGAGTSLVEGGGHVCGTAKANLGHCCEKHW
jgi:hypothetical protein